jgi:hypothetical protein
MRYQFLDALRGYAAIGVVLFHIGTRFGGLHTAVNGYIAVDFFFILSGVVLAGAYEARLAAKLNFTEFLALRLIRSKILQCMISKRWPISVFGVAIALLAGTGHAASPMSVRDFRETMGVNTHLNYTDGGYNQASKVLAALDYLGIRHVRDGAPFKGAQGQAALARAAQAGIRFDFVIRASRPLPASIADFLAFDSANPGAIATIEAPNEVNNWPLTYGALKDVPASKSYPATRAFVKDMRHLLRGTPLSRVQLLAPSWVGQATIDPDDADAGNAHPYPRNGDQASRQLAVEIAQQKKSLPGKPIFITETGYNDATNIKGEAVDPDTAAKLTLNLYAASALAGVVRTFPYQLLDAYADEGHRAWEKHWGFYSIDWQPKPVARAVHNLTTILTDRSSPAGKAGPAKAEIRRGAADLRRLDLMRSDGATMMLLWREVALWDHVKRQGNAIAPADVEIGFDRPHTFKIYSPATGIEPVGTSKGTMLTLPIKDAMMIVEISR